MEERHRSCQTNEQTQYRLGPGAAQGEGWEHVSWYHPLGLAGLSDWALAVRFVLLATAHCFLGPVTAIA